MSDSKKEDNPLAAVASRYVGAKFYENLTGGWPARIASKVVNNLYRPIGPDSVILDNCCGSGAITTAILELAKDQGFTPAKIHATDLSPGMINDVRELHKDEPALQTATMDAQELKFADNTFSHVICAFGVFFCRDPDVGFQEMYRVARPGSVTVVTSWMTVGWVPVVDYIIQKIRPGQKKFEFPVPPGFERAEWMQAKMTTCGWENVKVREIQDYTQAPNDIGSAIQPILGDALEGWTDEEKQRFTEMFDEAAEACGIEKAPEGWWKIDMVALETTGLKA
ncbi:hypothetical protein Dda_4194 [Drechslerella dactyloides]|uniref:Methyltransferase domain-containing protein n=1 Tax=Drechslerella dactyloides TaxID=74499 RepID=A0AAD6IZA9_DREDA|nr:hypothetical protein Dda_4194 [Drechslerella dactyloides]